MIVPMPLVLPATPRRRWGAIRLFATIRSWRQHATYEDAPNANDALPGSIGAFEQFFRQFEPRLFGYLWRMLGDEQAARDLCQETFLRAWEHFAEISAYSVPSAWLFRVATNLALSYLRRRTAPVGAAMPLEDDIDVLCGDQIAQVGERDHITRTLLGMPPKQRAVLVLHAVYGFSIEDAGRMLGISVAAARKLLTRAYQHFRLSYREKEDNS